MSTDAFAAVPVVRHRVPNRVPKVGLVLGSGLGRFADALDDAVAIPFAELPGFPETTIEGHDGQLVIGRHDGIEVACLKGRIHLYEGQRPQVVQTIIRTLRLLGCDTLVATNAAGALDVNATPGQLMVITDHINMQGVNPLVGPNDVRFGPRFPNMTHAYDPVLVDTLRAVAQAEGIPLTEGVYMAVMGPNFETPAEIRAWARLGANAIGMSTVPEIVVARHCGLRCAAISVLTNLGAGLSNVELSHEQTLEFAQRASESLILLLSAFLSRLSHPHR